jgi:transcriptional regulator of acetoin/glycerol metabolism
VFALDSQLRIFFANAAAAVWIGSPADDLPGTNCPPTWLPPPEVFQGEVKLLEIADRTPASSARIPLLYLPLTDEQGQTTGALGVLLTAGVRWLANPLVTEADSLRVRLQEVRRDLPKRFQALPLLGDSPAMHRVREQLALAAETKGRVLIVGHANSGREDVARAIHFREAARRELLVTVDGRVIDAEEMQRVVTSFLQQRQREPQSAPTTMLLLNADRLSPVAAQELSGFLKLPQVELPLIATAAHSLEVLARRDKFSATLAIQLSSLVIRLPKLRERPTDIPLLAQHLVEAWNREQPLSARRSLSSAAVDELVEYEWPRELTELEHIVRTACERAKTATIEPHDLPDVLRLASDAIAHPPRNDEPIVLDAFLAEIEKELIQRALQRSKNNKSKAAELLGMNRARLLRRLVQLGLAGQEEVVFEPLAEEPESDGNK